MEPVLTIVVATYARNAVLLRALESARRQTEQRWTALVVGDNCGPETRDAVNSLGDPRIRYVNLPARQGEQSRPNSVGMALAATPLIAFLNQDDLWLDDHLARALHAIDRGVEFYAASAAFAHETRSTPHEGIRPVFSERTPPGRKLDDAYSSSPFMFEPVSSWVISRRLAEGVGPWRSAVETSRGPLIDWVLRAMRFGATFASDEIITTMKVNTHHGASGSLEYQRGADDHDVLLALMSRLGADGLRSLIADDLEWAEEQGIPRRAIDQPLYVTTERETRANERLRNPSSLARFMNDGVDEFDALFHEAGRTPGDTLREALQRRTGEELGQSSPLESLIESARVQLA
jgi:hypothetical protein